MSEPVVDEQTWLTPGVRGIGAASLLSDLGHEIPTALLPSLLTSTLGAPASALGLIEGGIIPMPLWEADCTKRLETIRDIPPGKCIYWFERTDMVRAFEVLGDVVALRGNISPSLLTTGTPDEVDAAVRHLAENVFHKGGKLILDGAFGLPDETPVANVRAMYAAARKYGG